MAGPPRIVYLDVEDEITSAATRIRSADATRVALVVPPGSRVSTSRINFRLLAREAMTSGHQLAIVAPDAASRSLAAAAGIDVYRTVGEFEAADAEAHARSEDGEGGGGAVLGTAAGAAAATAAGGAAGRAAPPPSGAPAGRAGPAPGRSPAGAPPAAPPTTPTLTPAPSAADQAEDLRPRSSVADVRTVTSGGGPRSRRRIAIGVLAVFIIGLGLIAAVGAYLLLPQATIVVVPKVETIGPVTMTVTADPNATETDVANAVVPAKTIEFAVQASGTFKATGQNVTQTTATGTVTFTNCNFLGAASVKAGDRVATRGGVVFITNEALVIPAASFQPPSTLTCATRDVGITAVQPGTQGNVPAGAITVAPSDVNPVAVSVKNAQPTSGGSRTVTPKVVQADVDGARASLQKQLDDAFAQQMQAGTGVPSGMTLFPETGQLGPATFDPDPASLVGQEVADFTLGATATGTATAVDEGPVTQVAEEHVRAAVQPGYELVAGSVQATVGEPTVNGELVVFPTTATASQVRQLDAAELEAQVRGMPVDQAQQVLSQYGTVTITTWPDWVSAIPTYAFRVELTIEPAASPAPASSPGPSGSPGIPASPAPSTSAAPSPS
jgi:hypothetical protein